MNIIFIYQFADLSENLSANKSKTTKKKLVFSLYYPII